MNEGLPDSQAPPQPPDPSFDSAPAPAGVAGETVAPTIPLPPAPPAEQPADQPQEEVRPVPATAINDVPKAETMAHAEKEFRDEAAENRAIGKPAEEFVEKHNELQTIDDQLDKDPRQFSVIQRAKMKIKREKLDKETWNLLNKDMSRQRHADDVASNVFVDDFPQDRQPHGWGQHLAKAESRSARAEYYDEQASRIGDWAGILHDHPLSEEFLRSHSDLPTDPEEIPKRLVHLENNAMALERIVIAERATGRAPIAKEIAGLIEGSDAIPAMAAHQIEELDNELKVATKEEIAEYKRLTDNLQATGREFDEFSVMMHDKYEVRPLEEQMTLIKSIFDDIRREVGLPAEASKVEATGDGANIENNLGS